MSRRASRRTKSDRRQFRRNRPQCDNCSEPVSRSDWRCPECGHWLLTGTKLIAPLAVVALIALAVGAGYYALGPKGDDGEQAPTQEPYVHEISVVAFKYGYTPDVITVKKGEQVKITITNRDILHGINIPSLGLEGKETLSFTPQKTGEFAFYCDNYCGSGHGQMQGKLVVEA